eukprot:TRINITY_DN2468_c0_g1_i2.p1 TRINITY_DN2468_c0_g1~~TRINITY_DN2468_c0_g1_i2.p1  ORF type:complete len:608 (+),score=50.75 TRINITY_DN2468_c0_g1_i2:97-1920(+)
MPPAAPSAENGEWGLWLLLRGVLDGQEEHTDAPPRAPSTSPRPDAGCPEASSSAVASALRRCSEQEEGPPPLPQAAAVAALSADALSSSSTSHAGDQGEAVRDSGAVGAKMLDEVLCRAGLPEVSMPTAPPSSHEDLGSSAVATSAAIDGISGLAQLGASSLISLGAASSVSRVSWRLSDGPRDQPLQPGSREVVADYLKRKGSSVALASKQDNVDHHCEARTTQPRRRLRGKSPARQPLTHGVEAASCLAARSSISALANESSSCIQSASCVASPSGVRWRLQAPRQEVASSCMELRGSPDKLCRAQCAASPSRAPLLRRTDAANSSPRTSSFYAEESFGSSLPCPMTPERKSFGSPHTASVSRVRWRLSSASRRMSTKSPGREIVANFLQGRSNPCGSPPGASWHAPCMSGSPPLVKRRRITGKSPAREVGSYRSVPSTPCSTIRSPLTPVSWPPSPWSISGHSYVSEPSPCIRRRRISGKSPARELIHSAPCTPTRCPMTPVSCPPSPFSVSTPLVRRRLSGKSPCWKAGTDANSLQALPSSVAVRQQSSGGHLSPVRIRLRSTRQTQHAEVQRARCIGVPSTVQRSPLPVRASAGAPVSRNYF